MTSRTMLARPMFLFALVLPIGAAVSQTSTDTLEARLRAIEARLTALEKSAGQGQATPARAGVACTRLNINGSVQPGVTLEARVNGELVGTFSGGGVHQDLEESMRPGPNTVTLTFSGPSAMSNGELRCLPPGQTSSRRTIMTLVPAATKLSAQTEVNLVAR